MTEPEDARRIRDAFEHDLGRYCAAADLGQRAVRGGLRRARSRRMRRAAASLSAGSVLVAGLVSVGPAGVLWSRSGGAPPGTTLSGPLPSAAEVGKAMLTAFGAARDDVLYETLTGFYPGRREDDQYRFWDWPVGPVSGQPYLFRHVLISRRHRHWPLQLDEDVGVRFPAWPASPTQQVPARLTTVCYRVPGSSECATHFGNATRAGTWSLTAIRTPRLPIDVDSEFSAASIAMGITRGLWLVVGRGRLNGQPVIELRETTRPVQPPLTRIGPLPVVLWVNARTHLPARMTIGTRNGRLGLSMVNWAYLPPTTVNLRLLRVPIPPGYPRSTPTNF